DVIFVPTPKEVVEEMLKLADVKKDDLLYDLGCGDGIIVVTAAKEKGCHAIGYDIDPERVKEAKERAKEAGVENLVTIEEKDIFTVDLSKVPDFIPNKDTVKGTVVALYLLKELNEKLVPQLSKMKEGSRVVTHDFPIPGYKTVKEPTKVTVKGREHTVYLYKIPLEKEK
ncbi:MAG TPA: methyltransferase domain-containing protein, partial [Gemmataceae bacterium]|nr:methyltransferase domain-containing protein [Gemmataceae bacterium]